MEEIIKFIIDSARDYLLARILFSLAIIIVAAVFVLAIWRNPTRTSAIQETGLVVAAVPSVANDATSARLKLGVQAFFANTDKYGPDPATVFGQAKEIVMQLNDNPFALEKVDKEIERRKREEPNFWHANELSMAKALVTSLGLSSKSREENQIFIEMPMPPL